MSTENAHTNNSPKPLQFGLDTFGDIPTRNGELVTYAEAIRQVVKEAQLADKLGIEYIALGEHHRDDFAISSPETVLAAIASVTENIKLGTGVTVLSSDDPVRVFERFATVDALSNGRASVMLGRGSFTESFPLFGYDLRDYDALFEEKTELFAELLKEKPVTWEGQTRAALRNADVFPKTEAGSMETWIGVGGSPESVVRTARYGFNLMLAIIGGSARRFAPYVDLYFRAAEQLGTTPGLVGVHSPGFIARTDEEARERLFPTFKRNRDRIGRERGWGEFTRQQFEFEIEQGALYVGSPETVARKIADTAEALHLDRFDLIYGHGQQPVEDRELSIQLYGEEVIPRVRELLAERAERAGQTGRADSSGSSDKTVAEQG
ncbi:LLM class flavin-dependent oxidoreductase [Corynebacterium sp. 153RC1]|uniref:LLM class flavin-dependent oxidoreductase n=1 Tax=unclassified Corynebacterium TaxID=2624378 RepID=UPI00211CC66A|nr:MULTISPECIES: LLM class flavin-dependent oxidoreductase [unclassified Corynebacterium]MCQ9370558.1 LLM class flavin-dependent oxidoreductase [Corynebacterium sp. 35RC1]MCQ9352926.1 LLM class flavin-dependent oxidoreductase [Corynebacterium sp. 209RC1]MCQ9353854.1 LLM class flavin-dependent oxidoreductase [Corynebacterium sp. 1222RC1]MCQ9356885.1 LLM class flavin-dependent oxidoreductase [Corynebacterium sp. 122RC1]MCQ9358264.1 LLM class flavin-dependent oxidoreductase [Corynebacterium sp. 1